MKKTDISLLLRLLTLGLLFSLLSACTIPFNIRKSLKQNQSPQREKYVQTFAETGFDSSTNTGKFANQVFKELHRENFDWLENESAKARKDKEVLTGGFWKIRTFYSGLKPKNNTDEEFNRLFEILNRWKEKFPDSITPRVAIADVWQMYAGEARGGGYSDTVMDEGWKLFNERMKNSEKELIEAKDLAERCPYWYIAVMEITKGQGWDFNDFEALYQEAIAFEPDFYYFYRAKAMSLLPRWGGEEGQWETYLEQISREKGDMIYYLTVSHFVLNVGEIQFDRTKISWEKSKRGFEELKRTYGVEKQRLNEFAKFSSLANEFTTANEIFNEIGEDWDKEVWKSKGMFDTFRSIANKTYKPNRQIPPK